MKTLTIRLIAILICLFLVSCQPTKVDMLQRVCQQELQGSETQNQTTVNSKVELLSTRINDGQHKQKVDNLILLVDDSLRLLECQGPQRIRQRAFNLVDRINASLVGIEVNKGIRIFGPHADRNSFNSSTTYGMANGQKTTLEPSVISITPERPMLNPLSMALESIYHELKDIKGNTAVVLLSDFENLDSEVLATIKLQTQYYENRLCLYGVFLGDDSKHTLFLNKILGVDMCGFFTRETALSDPALLVDFLDNVLFEIIPADDSTITTTRVQPGTIPVEKHIPQNTSVPIKQTVSDETVKPVLTYKKLQVEKELRVELKTEFDFGLAVVRPEYADHLRAIADFMTQHQDTTTVIEGHTCDLGPDDYNMELSQKRADVVREFLVNTLGVDGKRITTKAYGESRPKVPNADEFNRKINRRAEAVITTTIIDEVDSSGPQINHYREGMQADTNRFTLHDSESVLDNKTGLMWATHDNGNDIGWAAAEKYCKEYQGGGFSDWRMASQDELQTLYLPEQKNENGFFITPLIKLTDCCTWASDVSMGSSGIFSFKTGKKPWGYQVDTHKLRALPVRTAQ
nr:OmpA family protein [Desulfobulbaceae bacterium]